MTARALRTLRLSLLALALAATTVALPTPSQAASEARQLVVTKPRASITETATGVRVDVAATIRNKTGKRQPASTLVVYLRAGNRRYQALTKPIGSIGAGASRDVTGKGTVPGLVPAGSYTANLCIERKLFRNCKAAPGTVVVEPADLELEPATVDLGELAKGATGTTTLTLANRGEAVASAPVVVTSGEPGFSVDTADCDGVALARNETCDVVVAFSSTAPFGHDTTVTAAASKGGSTDSVVSATVTPDPAALSFDVANRSFDPTLVGETAGPAQLTLTNDGDVPTGSLTVALAGTDASDFGVSSSTCGATLASGASCVVSLDFSPTDAGAKTARLEASAAPGGAVSVDLSGTGLDPAELQISPTSHQFADTLITTGSDTHAFTVTNTGDVASGSLTATIADAGPYEITGNGCTGVLAPDATCQVTVRFGPTAAGTTTNTLEVSAAPGGTASATLSGKGLRPASLSVDVTSLSYPNTPYPSFGTTPSGTSATKTVTVTNSGDVAAPLDRVIQGGDSARFGLNGASTCGAQLAGSSSCTYVVGYAPRRLHTQSATLVILSGATVFPVALTGNGSSPVSVTMEDIAFPATQVGSSSTVQITATNNGASNVSILFGNFNATWGSVQSCSAGAGLMAPGGSCTIDLTFSPSTTGAQSFEVVFAQDAGGNSVTAWLGLSGTGTAAPRSGAPAAPHASGGGRRGMGLHAVPNV